MRNLGRVLQFHDNTSYIVPAESDFLLHVSQSRTAGVLNSGTCYALLITDWGATFRKEHSTSFHQCVRQTKLTTHQQKPATALAIAVSFALLLSLSLLGVCVVVWRHDGETQHGRPTNGIVCDKSHCFGFGHGSCLGQQLGWNQSTRKRGHVRFAAISLRLFQPGHQQLAVAKPNDNRQLPTKFVYRFVARAANRVPFLCAGQVPTKFRIRQNQITQFEGVHKCVCVFVCVAVILCVCVCNQLKGVNCNNNNQSNSTKNTCMCVCSCVCVCVACVINFWHLNWPPSASRP